MDDNFRKRLDTIHDVRCPICGTKADWVQTSENGFQTLACGQQELIKIINDRSNLLRPSSEVHKQHTVTLDKPR